MQTLRSILRVFVLVASLCGTIFLESKVNAQTAPHAIDSPYMSMRWRDSVNNYAYRINAYHHESLSYDWAMMFSFFPVAGQAYVENTSRGFVYLGGRAAAVGVGTWGLIRLIKSDRTSLVDIGMLVGGVVAYVYLKIAEIVEVQHEVSHINEDIIDKFAIATEDIDSGSVRYPRKTWPDWVTNAPPARQTRSAREAIERPVSTTGAPDHMRLGIEIPF